MDPVTLPRYFDIYFEHGDWKMIWREGARDIRGLSESDPNEPVVVGPALGPKGITEAEAQRLAWKMLLSSMQQQVIARQSAMTIASYVIEKFVPEHVALKMPSSQLHYQWMLKHVLTPAEVDRAFSASATSARQKREALPDWPYLSHIRLCDIRPDHIRRITSAALESGYSTRTIKHIRNVISAIFSHARQGECFIGDNPVSKAQSFDLSSKEAPALTLAQTEKAFGMMRHPEKEMMLVAVLADINMAELCGLQWKMVNLSETETIVNGEPIPSMTIAIRQQWYRESLGILKRCRIRNLSVTPALFQVLTKLRKRERFTGPDDFVFVSRQGTPVNQNNIVARRLKPLAKQLGMPSLSWQIFRRTRKGLSTEFEGQFPEIMTTMVRAICPLDGSQLPKSEPFKRRPFSPTGRETDRPGVAAYPGPSMA